ncbi:uncharacterized protein LOC116186987 [Punica granatum]|uniref:Uncharacterized protein n=2 Tax=Punica granatum TaxID=22663 RepID=A0A218XQT5_PUNGR|nr:uncharacterized protein LOC116186987 [Punica granatum]OWM87168.1 hypothetical protein CDL15_Pgr010200 [Punica granatum]PKI70576.1 hypothetical protein CRG98_009081 [Punica granatum]
MEKKSYNSEARSPCYERILSSIRRSHVFRAIRRRALPGGPGTTPSSPPPPPPGTKILTITLAENGKKKDAPVHGNNGDQVAIIKPEKIAPATEPSEKTKARGQLEVPGASKKIEPEFSEEPSNEEKKSHGVNKLGRGSEHIENRVSKYIERVKLQLRTVSNVGGGAKAESAGKEKRDATLKTDDHFTNYLNRAKMKLRTTSSIGGGKAVPSK